jgi:ribosomal-protein-alanine N-acetyltransferase
MSAPCEITTDRLCLRRFDPASVEDQDFVVQLLNQRSFIDNIADRGVRTREDAIGYLRDGPQASFARHGFGLMKVERREDGVPIGMCGLLQRDFLEHPDIGYSLIDAHVGLGYAHEAAAATLAWGFARFQPARIVAMTAQHNEASIRLLLRLGFRDEGERQFPGYAEPSRYFELDAAASRA